MSSMPNSSGESEQKKRIDELTVAERAKIVHTYHTMTKHGDSGEYARSKGMDWRFQPNPYRSFDGALKVALPFFRSAPDRSSSDQSIFTLTAGSLLTPRIFLSDPSPSSAPSSLTADNGALFIDRVSQLMYYSMSLSA